MKSQVSNSLHQITLLGVFTIASCAERGSSLHRWMDGSQVRGEVLGHHFEMAAAGVVRRLHALHTMHL